MQRPLTVLATNPNADLYGASRMLLESAQGLLAEGATVVASIPPVGPLVDEIEAAGGRVRSVPSPVLRKASMSPAGLVRLAAETARAIPAGIRLLREVRPDVLYVNTLIQPLWLLLGWLLRIPMLCHVHEGESSEPRWVRTALALPLYLADRIVTNSRFSTRVVTDVAPRLEARCTVVVNGVDGPADPPPPRPNLDAPVRLLYVGRISARKGIGDAISAVARLRERGVETELHIVGAVFPGKDVEEEDLRAHAETCGVTPSVHWDGFDPDVWPHLAATDILLVPSRVDEAYGNTAVEGLIAARPVIATNISGLVEAMGPFDAAVMVPPTAPDALADAIEDVIRRWPELTAAAVADAPRARAAHAPSRYQAAIAEIVHRLADRRTSRQIVG